MTTKKELLDRIDELQKERFDAGDDAANAIRLTINTAMELANVVNMRRVLSIMEFRDRVLASENFSGEEVDREIISFLERILEDSLRDGIEIGRMMQWGYITFS